MNHPVFYTETALAPLSLLNLAHEISVSSMFNPIQYFHRRRGLRRRGQPRHRVRSRSPGACRVGSHPGEHRKVLERARTDRGLVLQGGRTVEQGGNSTENIFVRFFA